MSYGLSNWDKLHVLAWKNLCVSLKNHKRLTLAIIVPPLFCFVLVFLRYMVEVDPRPTKIFRQLEATVFWNHLLADIDDRRERLKNSYPNFTHNVFVPQRILAFAPGWKEDIDIMNKAVKDDLPGLALLPFASCDSMEEAMFKEHFFAGICFKKENSTTENEPRYLDYEIIYPSELRFYNDSYIGASWSTNQLFDLYNTNSHRLEAGHDGGYVGYIREGFAAIQSAVVMASIRMLKGKFISAPKIQRLPLYTRLNDPLIKTIQISISLAIVCGYLFPVANFTYMMIKEKELHVRKTLKRMEVASWIHFLAWYMVVFVCMAISAAIIASIFMIRWSHGRAILHNSTWGALFFALLVFNMASASFCIMMASIFSKVWTGVPITCIIWLVSYLPYIASSMNPTTVDVQLLACSFCNTVLGYLLKSAVAFEDLGEGFDFTVIGRKATTTTRLSPAAYISILIALSVIYILIALYVEEVNPSMRYIPKLWNLFFRPRDQRRRVILRHAPFATNMRQTQVYEIEPEYRKIALKIENLTKIYNGEHVVKNVTFNLYEGDITVVLGHNGAGKTTLLHMIAGMVCPTKGTVTMQDTDPTRHKSSSHKKMSVCLQDGLQFPELNIQDQLTIFGRLRGLAGNELHDAVERYLVAMRLADRRTVTTEKLSNGERKFLAVCCALIGYSKLLLLDDPSNGLDAFARKSLWELLRNERKLRTILLTTHSEEETEALGDRVAVLSAGELKCFGSTFFLKKIYGQGHRLICFKNKDFVTTTVNEVIQQYIPNIMPECELGAQVSYILEDARSHTQLLDELEERSEELGIQGITIAEVDSGDIFLRKGAEDPSEGERTRHTELMNGHSVYAREYERLRFMEQSERLTGFRLFLNHCEVMQIKRLLSSLRLTLLGLLQLLMPILFTIVSFSLLHYEHHRKALTPLTLSLTTYPESITVYYSTRETLDNNNSDVYNAYAEQLFWLGAPHLSEEVPHNEPIISYLLNHQKDRGVRIHRKHLIGASIGDDKTVAFFSNYPLHTVPISLHTLLNAMFRGIIDATARISSSFKPLKFASEHKIELKHVAASIGNYLAINISFCVGLTWSLCVIYLVRERRENFKLLQFLSGVRGHVFWFNNFIFDFFFIVVSSLIVLLTIVVFELDVFQEEYTSGAYFLVLVFTGTCMCSANYLVSIMCNDPVDAYIGLAIFNIFGTMSYWCYVETYDRNRRLDDTYDAFEIFTRLMPHFSLCNALVKIFDYAELEVVCKNDETRFISVDLENCQIEPNCCKEYKIWTIKSGILADLSYILVYGILCWVLLYLNETYFFWRQLLGYKKSEDMDDVSENIPDNISAHIHEKHPSIIDEEKSVSEISTSRYKEKRVICDRVTLREKNVDIIKNVTFSVEKAESFVLLGPNACGKSTLLKMLIGNLGTTEGSVYIDGFDINDVGMTCLYKKIGYCPQDELCLTEYTISELMRMVSLLRGLNNHDVVDTCDNLAKVLGFHKHVYKKLRICTPGIRRRFYCACAMIGNPQLLLLDEATSSIDIAGRRQLWNIICKLKESQHSVIFTSVVTQDCETIADRVAIMLNGRLSVISDPWTLNQEYAPGFLLKMKVKRIIVRVPESSDDWLLPTYRTISANPFLKLASFIENEFPMSKVKDQLGNIVVYFIPRSDATFSHIFEVMQRNAFILYVEDFLITRSALSVMLLETIEDERYRQLQSLK